MMKRLMLMVMLSMLFHKSYTFPIWEKNDAYFDRGRWQLPGPPQFPEKDGDGGDDVLKDLYQRATWVTGDPQNYGTKDQEQETKGTCVDVADKKDDANEVIGKTSDNTFIQVLDTSDAARYNREMPRFAQGFIDWVDWKKKAMEYDADDYEEDFYRTLHRTEKLHSTEAALWYDDEKTSTKGDSGKETQSKPRHKTDRYILWWFLLFISKILLAILIVWTFAVICCKEFVNEYQKPTPVCSCGASRLLVKKPKEHNLSEVPKHNPR